MNAYAILTKIRERWVRRHTAMLGRALGAYGGDCRLEYPLVINDPKRLFVGRNTIICANTMLACVNEWEGQGGYAGEIHIGDKVEIRENVQISAALRVTIGDYVGIARNVIISDHDHTYELVDRKLRDNPITKPRPVTLTENCFIAANVRIGPGVTVGNHSVVSTGSVVTKDVPPFTVVAGAPARPIRRYNADTGRWEFCRPRRRGKRRSDDG